MGKESCLHMTFDIQLYSFINWVFHEDAFLYFRKGQPQINPRIAVGLQKLLRFP